MGKPANPQGPGSLARFAHANLDNAKFDKANLANATLLETSLRKTDLSGANLPDTAPARPNSTFG